MSEVCKKQNYCMIIDKNDNEHEWDFDELYEDNTFIIIDKQLLGEEIGKKICDKVNSWIDGKLVSKEKIYEKNGNYTSEFFDEVLTKIEEDITNEIRNDICHEVFCYLDNNLE